MTQLPAPSHLDLVQNVIGSSNRIFGESWNSDHHLREFVGQRAGHLSTQLSLIAQLRSGRKIRAEVFHALGSFDARFCALILSWPKKAKPVKLDEAIEIAKGLDARQPCMEPVQTYLKPKPEGGTRRIWVSGPRRRALQCLAKLILQAIWGPAKFEFAQRGRGRDKAMDQFTQSILQKGGTRWILTADIESCYGSFNREALLKIISLPRAVIENCIFITKDVPINDISNMLTNTSEIAVLSGLPQGSLASPYIVSKLIEPVLEKLSGKVVLNYVDDIGVGTFTKAEAQANEQKLGDQLKDHPAGPLFMKCHIAPLGKPIDFLGYRIRRRWKQYGGGARLTPCAKSFKRFEIRLRSLLEKNPKSEKYAVAESYTKNWRTSFHLWDRSETGDVLLDLEAHHVIQSATFHK